MKECFADYADSYEEYKSFIYSYLRIDLLLLDMKHNVTDCIFCLKMSCPSGNVLL